MSARLAYAALFCVALPVLLAAWAVRLDTVLDLPAYGSATWGGAVAALGLALMAAATRDLWVYGQGLPASPFPPRRLVTRGIYGLIAHPVYLGAVLVSLGASLAAPSAAGDSSPLSTSAHSTGRFGSSESRTEQYFVTASSIARSACTRSIPSPSMWNSSRT